MNEIHFCRLRGGGRDTIRRTLMPENRAYKLNAQRQPGNKPETFMYYYYDADGHLICSELNSKLIDKLVEMDKVTTY